MMAGWYESADPLYLVWLAGNGQLVAKAKTVKYKERIRQADIPTLVNAVRRYVTGERWAKEFGMKKVSVLMHGITIVHQLQVELLEKRVVIYFEKLSSPVIIPALGDGDRAISIPRKRVRNPRLEDCNSENQVAEFGECNVEVDIEYLNAEPRMGALAPLDLSIPSSDENAPPRMRAHTSRNLRRGENDENKENIRPSRNLNDELPSQDDILDILRRQARTRNPLGNLMLDPDLPLPPPTSQMSFGDNDMNVEPGGIQMYTSFHDTTGTSGGVIDRGEVSPEMLLEPLNQSPKRKSKKTTTILPESHGIMKPKERKRSNLKFVDKEIELSNEFMGGQIRSWQAKFLLEKPSILSRMKPLSIKHATEMAKRKNCSGLKPKLYLKSMVGSELKFLSGPHIHGKQLSDWLKTRSPLSELPPGPLEVKSRQEEEQLRLQMSGVAGTSTAGSSLLIGERADFSGNPLLSKSGGPMTSALELGSSYVSPPHPHSPLMLEPVVLDYGRVGSPQPQLAEASARLFKHVVPRGLDRKYACRYFSSLLEVGKSALGAKEAVWKYQDLYSKTLRLT